MSTVRSLHLQSYAVMAAEFWIIAPDILCYLCCSNKHVYDYCEELSENLYDRSVGVYIDIVRDLCLNRWCDAIHTEIMREFLPHTAPYCRCRVCHIHRRYYQERFRGYR